MIGSAASTVRQQLRPLDFLPIVKGQIAGGGSVTPPGDLFLHRTGHAQIGKLPPTSGLIQARAVLTAVKTAARRCSVAFGQS